MELEDIQGILIRGHKEMTVASYFMLSINNVEKARLWLKKLIPNITNGISKPEDYRLQLAFTYDGIHQFIPNEMYGFAVEFVQGMATEYRSRVLGDIEESSTEKWQWGGPSNPTIHMVLMVYAKNKSTLTTKTALLKNELSTQGITLITELDAPENKHGKEHFGFRDGMTQPTIEGLGKEDIPENTLKAGEFILGYKNGYNQLPDTPLVFAELDEGQLLPNSITNQGFKDFGKNGSYMVFRQLTQNVPAFWQQAKDAAIQMGLTEKECVFAASKMVGRWPNGTPLTIAPHREEPFQEPEKYFLYRHQQDETGFNCPMGAHVRRSNPRDILPDNNPESSVKISNLHRILRRGRNFGPPLVDTMTIESIQNAPNDHQERGLHFICFNTNIARQFEFVQHMWCNNTKFAGQYNDPDPVLGIKDHRDKSKTHEFTIQDEPVRKKVRGLTRHVQVVGGAYFFMPGLNALKYLAHQQTQH